VIALRRRPRRDGGSGRARPQSSVAISIEPTDDLTRYQQKLIDAVAPFTVKTGSAAAFVTTKEAPTSTSRSTPW